MTSHRSQVTGGTFFAEKVAQILMSAVCLLVLPSPGIWHCRSPGTPTSASLHA